MILFRFLRWMTIGNRFGCSFWRACDYYWIYDDDHEPVNVGCRRCTWRKYR